jgi:hypothetical protein
MSKKKRGRGRDTKPRRRRQGKYAKATRISGAYMKETALRMVTRRVICEMAGYVFYSTGGDHVRACEVAKWRHWVAGAVRVDGRRYWGAK